MGLTALLDARSSHEEGALRIAMVPALVDEARAALPALRALVTAPAGPEGVKQVVATRFALYPQPARTEGEWAAWWADYFHVLAELPLVGLEAGMRMWIATPTSEFLPKPGQLRDLARLAPSRAIARYERARQAVRLADAALRTTPEPADPAAVKAMLAEYLGQAVVA